jgi:WD40 repeat protein
LIRRYLNRIRLNSLSYGIKERKENSRKKEMPSSEETSEQEPQSQEDESKSQPQQESTKDESKSKNSTKKAQYFDFETLFQKTIHDQQIRNSERQATFTDSNPEKATDVEARLADFSLSGGRNINVDASSNNVKVNKEVDEDIGPALPPGFVPDKSVQVTNFAESNKKSAAEEDDDEDDVTASSLIPATYEARIVHGHKAVLSLAFDAQGSKFVTGGQNYAVQFFDFLKMDSAMKPFREVYPAESHVINTLSFSTNGETLLVGTGEAQIRLLDRMGKQWAETVRGDQYLVDLAITKGHTAAVNHLCWHPFNKKEFLSCSDDGSLRLWDTDDFKVITKCINKQRKVIKTKNAGGRRTIPTTCCYSRDGKLIAAGCDDGSIQIWKHGQNFANVKYLNRTAHKGSICSLEFSPDSKQILSRGMDDTLKIFDIEKFKEPMHQVENLPCMYIHSSCGYSPHGEFVFTTTSTREGKGKETGSLLFFNSSNLELQYRIEYADAAAIACSWHPKLDQILVGLSDGTCRLYYDPRSSVRGALLCATRPIKRIRTNEVVKEEMIIAPLALEMFQPRGEEGEEKDLTEWRLRRVLRMNSGRKKPQFRKPAEMPMQGTSAGGRLAKSGGTLHSYIAQQLGKSQNQTFIQDEDVRQSILRHADVAEKEPLYISKAYKRTQPVPIFAQDELDEDEPEYKVSKPNS